MGFWRTKKNPDGSLEWEAFPVYEFKESDKKNLEAAARAFATSNPDIKDETLLTDPENLKLAEVNKYIAELREWYDHGVGAIKDKIASVAGDADYVSKFRKIKGNFDRDCQKAAHDFNHDYKKEKRAYDQNLLYLRSFRDRYKDCGLKERPAHYPDSIPFHLSIVFLAMIGESFANSYFFGQAGGAGLLGGFLVAMLVSLANVILSMVAGFYSLRRFQLPSAIQKTFGFITFLFSLAAITAIHLTAAHYREALTANPDAEGFAALEKLRESPLGLTELDSLLLVVIGAVITVISLWKGYTLDDSFPGYGHVWRRFKTAEDKLNEIEKDLKSRVGIAYENAREESENILERWKQEKKDLELLEGDIGARLQSSENYFESARQGALGIINTFRGTVHSVYNDDTRFPHHDGMLEDQVALLSLDQNNYKEGLYKLLNETVSKLTKSIELHPKEQKKFLRNLEGACRNYASREKLAGIMREIEKDLPDLANTDDLDPTKNALADTTNAI